MQLRKESANHKAFCDSISELCKGVLALVAKGQNYGNAIAKLFGIAGFNSIGPQDLVHFFAFRKTLLELLPSNQITFDLLKDHDISLGDINSVFQDRKSFFYGGKDEFGKNMVQCTKYRFQTNPGDTSFKINPKYQDSAFILSLVDQV